MKGRKKCGLKSRPNLSNEDDLKLFSSVGAKCAWATAIVHPPPKDKTRRGAPLRVRSFITKTGRILAAEGGSKRQAARRVWEDMELSAADPLCQCFRRHRQLCYPDPIGGGGNSITVSTSWDVSSFGGALPAPQSLGAGYACSSFFSLALLCQLQVTPLE